MASKHDRKKARREGPRPPADRPHLPRQAGRPRKIDQPARVAGPADEAGTPQLHARRAALGINEAKSGIKGQTAIDFPLDVLAAKGFISSDMRDVGIEFAMKAWWLYGRPDASCEGLYNRMIAGGFGGEDFAPRAEGETPAEDELRRIRSHKARFARMVKALGGVTAPTFGVVRAVCQYLEPPRFLEVMTGASPDGRTTAAATDYAQMEMLAAGLGKLVRLRHAEDRHWTRQRREAVDAIMVGGRGWRGARVRINEVERAGAGQAVSLGERLSGAGGN